MRTHKLSDGNNYLAVNPIGQVPALRTDEGPILTENMAILLYLADHFPEATLAPQSGLDRYEDNHRWSFIDRELHMRVFKALVSFRPDDGSKVAAHDAAPSRLALLSADLEGRDFLCRGFRDADAALFAVLNWARHIRMDLKPYPAISAFHRRIVVRPAVARAMKEEMELLQAT